MKRLLGVLLAVGIISVSALCAQAGDTSFSYHSLSDSSGNYTTGTSTTIGSYTYHSFSDSSGNTLSGTSTQIGSYTYHSLSGSNGESVTGTTTTFGN